MSLSLRNDANGALLEKVITANDLGGLSPLEKVQHIKNVCESLGLNPLTKPIQLIKFQGKEIAYFTKDATEQLRKTNGISIKIRDTKIVEGIYIVIVDAKTKDGREDSSTGALSVAGLKGDALCNAMLKAETKAKRRVTLSICGLGFTDESELETMKGHQKVNVEPMKLESIDDSEMDYQADLKRLKECNNLQELGESYKTIISTWKQKGDVERAKKINAYTEIRKKEIESIVSNFDADTGEVEDVK